MSLWQQCYYSGLGLGMNIQLLVYHTLNNIVSIAQFFWWKLTGVEAHLDRAMKGLEDEGDPAQVLQVIMKYPYVPLTSVGNCYISLHEKFVPARYVLRKKNVLLSCITPDNKVYFIEHGPDVNLFDAERFPVTAVGLWETVSRVIVVPFSTMRKVLEEEEIQTPKVAWWFNTLRCGSTATLQYFNSLPKWSVLSENPTHYDYLSTFCKAHNQVEFDSFVGSEQFDELIRMVIKLSLKNVPVGNSACWKPIGTTEMFMIPIIAKYFKHHKMFFLYRDPQPSAQSFYRGFNDYPTFRELAETSNGDPKTCLVRYKRFFWNSGLLNEANEITSQFTQSMTTFDWYILMFSCIVTQLNNMAAQGYDVTFVKYERLVADRTGYLTKIFTKCEIPLDQISLAEQSLNRDSQAGTPFSQEAVKFKSNCPSDTAACVERCNRILHHFNLPCLGESLLLPNTL